MLNPLIRVESVGDEEKNLSHHPNVGKAASGDSAARRHHLHNLPPLLLFLVNRVTRGTWAHETSTHTHKALMFSGQ